MAKKKKLTGEGEKGAKETTKRRKDIDYVRDDLEEYLADCGINCVTPKRVKDTVNDSGDDLEEDLADCSLNYNILVPDEVRSDDDKLRPHNTCQIRNPKCGSINHAKKQETTLEDSVQILEDEIEAELDSSAVALEGDQEYSNCHLIDKGKEPRDIKATQIFLEVGDTIVQPLNTVINDIHKAELRNRIGIIDYSECVSELDASVIIIDDNMKAVTDTYEKNVDKGVVELLDRDVDLDASVIILNNSKREAHNQIEPPCTDDGKKRLERDAEGQAFPLQIENQVLEGNTAESDLDEDDIMDPKLCDSLNQLLESDDEDLDSEDEVRSKEEEEVREGEVVWRLWYRGSTNKKRVADLDLTPLPPLVMAQLCLVTGLLKGRGGAVKEVSVVAIPGNEQPVEVGKERKVAARCIRRLGGVAADRRILQSQTYRRDFAALRSSFSSVERFLTNHVGCARVAEDERRTAAEYFALDCMERCEYLEGLRRLKQGLPKELPRVLEESAVAEPEVEEETAEDVEEEAAEKEETMPAAITAEDDYLETLEPEAQLLVAGLPPSWPMDLTREPAMLANLKRILTRRKRSRRHEMFLDRRQRDMRSGLPELVRISNPSFLNIFGKRRHRLDAQVRVSLLRSLLGPDSSGSWDTRLGSLMGQSQHLSSQYVELVLYPELFISWLMVVRGCKYEQADSFFRTTGTLLTRSEKECQIASWLDLGGRKNLEDI